jgi:glycosyltransferase involved in cell wall biosynthesis
MELNIGFDAKRIFQNYTGLGNYSRTLVKNLVHFFPENTYQLFTPKVKVNDTTAFFVENPSLSIHTPLHPMKAAWRTFGMNRDLKKSGCQIFHGLSHEIPVGIQNTGIQTVVTMHDLIFKIYPEYYPTAQRWIYDWKFRYACENSDTIIAISEQTKQDIVTYYKIPDHKIKVIYQTCGDAFQQPIDIESVVATKTAWALPSEYMLYVGSIIERKNLLRIVQAMAQLPKDLDIPLVVVGNGKAYEQKVKSFLAEHHLEKRVIFIPNIRYDLLPQIYAGASLFLYPSEYEGFGIPVIEALFSKTPVITSNCSCLPEAAGSDALLVTPTSVEEIKIAIERGLKDTALRDNMIEKGYHHAVKNFSAEKVSHDLQSLYQGLKGR